MKSKGTNGCQGLVYGHYEKLVKVSSGKLYMATILKLYDNNMATISKTISSTSKLFDSVTLRPKSSSNFDVMLLPH